MREVNENEALIRQFLLDELREDERHRIEEVFITDEDYREKILMAEDDLIDDYLEGALSASERERFLSRYLSAPQQRRKLRIAKAIKQYSGSEVASPRPPSGGGASRHSAGRRGRVNWLSLRNPLVSLPLAAAVVVAFGLVAMKVADSWRFNQQREQEQALRSADEQELARLNDRSLPDQRPAGGAFSVALLPVSTRGSGAKFSTPADASPVVLLLVLQGDEYRSYEVDLQRMGGAQRRTVRNLRAEDTAAGKAVALIVPAKLLPRGSYQLRLTGITAAGGSEEVGEYTFEVPGR